MFLWHVHHPLLFNLDMHLFAYSTLFIWGCDMLIGHHNLVDQFYRVVNTFAPCNLAFKLRSRVLRLIYQRLQPCNVLSCIQIDVHFYQTNEMGHFIYLFMIFLIFQ